MRTSMLRIVLTTALAVGAVAAIAAQDGSAPSLKDPATLVEPAPDKYHVKFDTSAGAFTVEVQRDWAPRAATRFYNLVKNGYYDDCRFFRVLNGFMAQFGVNGDPAINNVWRVARIVDDARKQSNERTYVSFAAGGPNTRTTQVLINLNDNKMLDTVGLAPFGKVTSGMNVVEKLYKEYGDGPPNGKGPEQSKIQIEGNAYLAKSFPKLDYIRKATIEPEKP